LAPSATIHAQHRGLNLTRYRLNAGLAMRDVGRTRRGLGFVKIRRMRQSQPQQGRHPALAGQTNGRKRDDD
jgi:hypothetical protein